MKTNYGIDILKRLEIFRSSLKAMSKDLEVKNKEVYQVTLEMFDYCMRMKI